MVIRKMEIADIQKILLLQNQLKFQDWNSKQFEAEIKASYAYAIVYENEGDILGYAIFHLMGADSELLSIAVKKSAQGLGVGSLLLKNGIENLDLENGDQCFLEVRVGNISARRFYEKHNFVEYYCRKNYYDDGEDAALYKLCKN